MPNTAPEPAHATAAKSISRGGMPQHSRAPSRNGSREKQLRRASPFKEPLVLALSSLPSQLNSARWSSVMQ
eukprot:scaffold41942_cov76-Phaeocystis_antarctica.AAC.8